MAGTVRYIERADDASYYNLSENQRTVIGLKLRSPRYKILYIPQGVRTLHRGAFYEINVKQVVLPEGVEKIERASFKHCKQLRMIYIPASVKVIEDEAFLGCSKVEIYCEGEPQEGWLDGEKVEREYWVDMTDAFNFHRSGGSFDDHYAEKRIEVTYNNYNPEKRPVHTNVSREEFLKLLEQAS